MPGNFNKRLIRFVSRLFLLSPLLAVHLLCSVESRHALKFELLEESAKVFSALH